MFDSNDDTCSRTPTKGDSARRSLMPPTTPLILIVDLDAAALAVCEELLQRVGYATLAYQTAREAQRHIDMDRPDLLLVELDLEWYDAGWDLLCWLRQGRATAGIPAILCATDRSRLLARQRQQYAEPCQILDKPFSASELWTAVATALALAPLRSQTVGA
jgi:two-component system, NtrC family, response regulator GlrR